MPLVIDRRRFLKTALAAGFAVRLSADEAAPTRWALLSDVHCPQDPNLEVRGFRPTENLKKVAAEVASSGAQLCTICGDLARLTGDAGDYAALKGVIDPVLSRMPAGFVMGNHDNRQNFLKTFTSPHGKRQAVPRKLVFTLEWTDWRAVLLDSLLETNVTPGQLGTAQRQWLGEYIRADKRPVFLFLHHDFGDGDGALVDATKFFQLIAPLEQVKAVFYGHSHDYKFDVHEGIHLVNIPSTAYTFRPKEPAGWVLMTLSAKGAQFRLSAVAANTERHGTTTSLKWR